ncbi:MAG: DUF6798 domain-containing protein, partial [Bacillota bacterium]
MTRIASQPALSDLPGRCPRLSLPDLTTLALGIALTVGFQGYQFGQSNHAVYLPPALHQFDPSLLRNDWFTTATLQYHTLFTTFSAALMRFHIIQPAFFISYFALVVLFHLAWLRLTWLLGGSRQTYALSVGLYYLSGAGLGLGMYQFLQDSAFLPSNIANVAMLWGVCFLAASRPLAAASTLGLASLFHLNHAVVAPLLWGFRFLLPPRAWRDKGGVFFGVPLFPSLLLLGVCAVAVGPILPRILARPQPIAFQEFIDLYVRLRHPHHYDPSSWPWYLWVAFLWPMPLAMGVYRRCPAVFRCGLFFACLQLLALLFAGLFYVSESVVQLSLYRFSIYVKLLSCIAAGYVIWDRFLLPRGRHPWLAQGLPASLLVFCMGILVFRQTWPMDLWPIPRDDKDYRALCQWARRHTPVDALFLVPPDEQSFRLHGQRAIVVNFKGVPQLSSELPEWRRRLESVLGMENLLDL